MNALLKVMVFVLNGIVLISAQKTVKLQGKVVDFHNNINLVDAKVTVGNRTVYTNANGIFTIEELPVGTYVLKATHHDCEAYQEEINMSENMFLRIPLEHHALEIEQVNIKSKGKPSVTSKVSTVNQKIIQNNTTENLGNILTKVAGVNALKTGNSITKPVIRGLYGSRVLVYNNNVRMAEQEWGVEHAPSIDVNAFENIQVVKGAKALKYGGDAIGGVVAMNPELFPAKDTLLGKAMITGISNGKGLHFNTQIAKTWENQWYVKTQGAYKKMGDYSTPDFSLNNTALEEQSLSFGFGKRSFREGMEIYYSRMYQNLAIFRGSHIGFSNEFFQVLSGQKTLYVDDFDYKIASPRQDINHHLAKLALYKRFDKIGKLSFDYSFQHNRRKEYDVRWKKFSHLPSMDMQLTTHQISLTQLLERENWELETGISASFQKNYMNPETGVRRLIPDYKKYDASIFTIFQKTWSKKLKTELGLRYDYNYIDAYKYYRKNDWNNLYAGKYDEFFLKNVDAQVLTRPQFHFHNFSTNVGVRYQPYQNTLLRASASRSSRMPNPAELFADGLHHSASMIERGNLDIRQEVAYQFGLDVEQKINVLGGWELGVHPYLLWSDNFIQQTPTEIRETVRGIFPVWIYQQISARMYGLEAESELKIFKNLEFKTHFSKVIGDNLTNDEPLFLIAPAQLTNEFQLEFWKEKKAYFSIENATTFRQKRFVERNLNITIVENNQLVERTLDLSTPPAGYSLFNLSAGIDVFKNFNANLKVNNLLNQRYKAYLNRLRYYSDEIGRNFLLTITYQF